MGNFAEIARASSMANWRLQGREGLVKVMSKSSAQYMQLKSDLSQVRVKGYIGLAKYIYGLNAAQIERALGLPPASMVSGAYIYSLSRLPTFNEVDFRYSLAWPDGKVPTPAEYTALLDRRDAAIVGLTSEPTLYPPGGSHIPQWRLNFNGAQPGIPGNLIEVVTNTTHFHRDKAYSPHNRDPNWGRVLA